MSDIIRLKYLGNLVSDLRNKIFNLEKKGKKFICIANIYIYIDRWKEKSILAVSYRATNFSHVLSFFRRFRHDTRNSSPLDIFSPHSKFTAPQSPSHVNYPPGSRDGTIARSSKDYLFIQRDNHGRGDRSTRRVLNRRREEIRSNEKKWSRRRIVNTGANRLGTKKTYSSKDTRRVSKYSQRERSSLDEGEPFSLQTRARVLPILPSSRLLRFLPR